MDGKSGQNIRFVLFVSLVMFLETVLCQRCTEKNAEYAPEAIEELYKYLFANYGIYTRSVLNGDDSVNVEVKFQHVIVSETFSEVKDVLAQVNIVQRSFPYDRQYCWIYFSNIFQNVNFTVVGANEPLGSERCVSTHDQWQVIRCTSFSEVRNNSITGFRLISLIISMQRRSIYYVFLLIVPAIIVVFLLLVIFLIPHCSNQRFSYVGGMLFVLLLLNYVEQEFIPTGFGDTPRIVSYTLYALILLSAITILSLVTHYLYFIDPGVTAVPAAVQKIFLNGIVKCIMGLKPNVYFSLDSINASSVYDKNYKNSQKNNQNEESFLDWLIAEENESESEVSRKFLEEIHKNLDVITFGEKSRVLDNEWKQLSTIFDRLLFFLFFVDTVLVTSFFFGQNLQDKVERDQTDEKIAAEYFHQFIS
ncbi:hypothetical protein HELRODRAFT_183641 [Helobdella robusta]|uniref:Neurotransmitter-gated ion-channel ligand-binding domain-containing protein n=1 Tax=Helobdella robusta TaxID=6412 RepID=T1FJZ2_HELRO|nr:hypothetical protein HELRODRAFT_183641 [Helobdella robusta]ESO10419.1 hypothetical protein HELRODRAFT_183641 [Helobdella robusta]